MADTDETGSTAAILARLDALEADRSRLEAENAELRSELRASNRGLAARVEQLAARPARKGGSQGARPRSTPSAASHVDRRQALRAGLGAAGAVVAGAVLLDADPAAANNGDALITGSQNQGLTAATGIAVTGNAAGYGLGWFDQGGAFHDAVDRPAIIGHARRYPTYNFNIGVEGYGTNGATGVVAAASGDGTGLLAFADTSQAIQAVTASTVSTAIGAYADNSVAISAQGKGGINASSTGTGNAITAFFNGGTGIGVQVVGNISSPAINTTGGSKGVVVTCNGRGVDASSVNDEGVYAHSDTDIGVLGNSRDTTGVRGEGKLIGVEGVVTTVGAIGVKGTAGAGGFALDGTSSSGGTAVRGTADTGIGVQAVSTSGTALYVATNGGRAITLTSKGTHMGFVGNNRPRPTLDAVGHQPGEVVYDENLELWLCTAGGTPGTWKKLGGPATAGQFHVLDTPARVYDSRPFTSPNVGSKTPLAANTNRSVDLKANSSTVPADATAVMVNLLLLNLVAGTGNFTVWANGAAKPLANTMVFANTASSNRASTLAVTKVDAAALCQVNSSLKTDLVVDVVGYYR